MKLVCWGKLMLPLVFTAGLLIINCTTNMNLHDPGEGETVYPACDPDGAAPCPDAWFICTESDGNNKLCEGQNPAIPDAEGGWDCVEQGTTLICTGDHMPSDDGIWICQDNGDGTVTCRTHAWVPAGDGGTWNCWYQDDYRYCEFIPGPGDGGDGGGGDGDSDGDGDGDGDIPGTGGGEECPPGIEIPQEEECGDGIDNDCDGRVDEDCGSDGDADGDADGDGDSDGDGDADGDGGDDCLCIPGAWRFCDTPAYCLWGIQRCADTGLEWGACNETTAIPPECAGIDGWYSPNAQACCVVNGHCCQDMWDQDHDGDTWESLGDCTGIICI